MEGVAYLLLLSLLVVSERPGPPRSRKRRETDTQVAGEDEEDEKETRVGVSEQVMDGKGGRSEKAELLAEKGESALRMLLTLAC